MRQPEHSQDIIDVADGLDRVMGDQHLYGRMLARFRKDYATGALAVQRAFDHGDLATAQLLAHTLIGAAGMIGARRLHAQASAAEQALRTGAPMQREQIRALEVEFQLVIGLLDVLLDDGSAPHPGAPRSLPEDPALLERLTELLRNGDGAAVDLVEENAASLGVILGEPALLQVTAAVNDFDYERALGALARSANPARRGR